MSTLMPRSGIPVICSRATLSCDSSYYSHEILLDIARECLRNGDSDDLPVAALTKEQLQALLHLIKVT